MFVHGDGGDCQFICTNCPGTPPEGTTVLPPGTFPGIALDHLVDFDMRNASLGEAAELLARRAYAEIFVPVNRIDERRDMRLESVPLDTVVRELGLMAVEPAS
jgi:hypothetical protein